MSATPQLIIFVKAPRAGSVKTRLARTLGAEAALDAYHILVTTLLRNLAGLKKVELRFSPDDAANEIRLWLERDWTLEAQGDGDLGKKLQRAFEKHFARGKNAVVIIGSDCPQIECADIAAGWQALEKCDVVLGPARDGGYWLIGLRQPQPHLFENISWSTATVLRETLAAAREEKLTVHLLRELRDVDTEMDWKEFCARRTNSRP
jgi:rSAM/selenodomain-associated transferase 1